MAHMLYKLDLTFEWADQLLLRDTSFNFISLIIRDFLQLWFFYSHGIARSNGNYRGSYVSVDTGQNDMF